MLCIFARNCDANYELRYDCDCDCESRISYRASRFAIAFSISISISCSISIGRLDSWDNWWLWVSAKCRERVICMHTNIASTSPSLFPPLLTTSHLVGAWMCRKSSGPMVESGAELWAAAAAAVACRYHLSSDSCQMWAPRKVWPICHTNRLYPPLLLPPLASMFAISMQMTICPDRPYIGNI